MRSVSQDLRKTLRFISRPPSMSTLRSLSCCAIFRSFPCANIIWAPFYGTANIAYIPAADGRICGLSKLARLVEVFARRPQVQERLTSQIADTLMRELAPQGVVVVIKAEHMCMNMRGVKKPGSKTVTRAVRGLFEQDATARARCACAHGRVGVRNFCE